MRNENREQPPGHWLHRFEVATEFSDALARLISAAVTRLRFLEVGVKHVLDRELVAYRDWQARAQPAPLRMHVV